MKDKKAVKADEKAVKKSVKARVKELKDSNETPQHEEGQFAGPGALNRARQRRFDTTGELPSPRHPGVGGPLDFASINTPDVGEDEDGAV